MGKVKYNNSPPETERNLMALQSQYLEDKTNSKVFNEFFLLVKAYSRSITLSILKRLGKSYHRKGLMKSLLMQHSRPSRCTTRKDGL